jgi:general secretion pathway protein C
LGVIAAEETPKGGRDGGVALISVDGRPPVAVHIGHRISRHEDLVVQTISRTSVGIGPEGGDLVATLALPAMPSPAQGSLPDTERLTDQSDNPSEPQAATPDDQ